MRFPDTYYSTAVMIGTPKEQGVKQRSPIFYQGTDIFLSFYLNYNGQPVSFEKHDLIVIVKKEVEASGILWQGVPGDGLFSTNIAGYFYILIPADITEHWVPGTYFFDVKLTEKIGQNQEYSRNLTSVIMQNSFELLLSTTSPNPKLRSEGKELRVIPFQGLSYVPRELTIPYIVSHPKFIVNPDVDVFYFISEASSGKAQVYFCDGDPNGRITAIRPALCYTPSGGVWLKTNSGNNNTGWVKIIADQ